MTTLADRPHSLPAASKVSVTSIERLRSIGSDDSNNDALAKDGNDGTADLLLAELVDGGKGCAITEHKYEHGHERCATAHYLRAPSSAAEADTIIRRRRRQTPAGLPIGDVAGVGTREQ